MAYFIEFPGENGGASILVEVDATEIDDAAPGTAKAGLLGKKKAGDVIVKAALSFDDAVKRVIGENAKAVAGAISGLAKPPTEFELTFALKATGEAGNIAVGKLGGEVNFQVRLLWKAQGSAAPGAGAQGAGAQGTAVQGAG